MNNLVKMSCICMTYGRTKCLEEAIQFFLDQNYLGEKELIIVNDLKEQTLIYNHKDIKIFNFKERFISLGAKRDFAIQQATGDVILTWDDDDGYLPNHISLCSKLINGYDYAKPSKCFVWIGAGKNSQIERIAGCFMPQVIFTKKIYNQVNGYNKNISYGEDMDLSSKMLSYKNLQYKFYQNEPEDTENITYLYRWGNNEYHLSGYGNDSGYRDIGRNIDQFLKLGKIQTGTIYLNPHHSKNYYQMVNEWLKNQNKIQHIYQNSCFGEDWFTYPELYREIVSSAKDGDHFVEIGSWKGKSTAFMATEIANSKKNIKFDCVDTWHGSPEHGDQFKNNDELYNIFLNNMKTLTKWFNPIREDSIIAHKQYQDNSLDFVFLDANHSYESVREDLINWLPKIKKGGIFAGHDYDCGWPGVVKAVDEVIGKSNITYRYGCWIYRK